MGLGEKMLAKERKKKKSESNDVPENATPLMWSAVGMKIICGRWDSLREG